MKKRISLLLCILMLLLCVQSACAVTLSKSVAINSTLKKFSFSVAPILTLDNPRRDLGCRLPPDTSFGKADEKPRNRNSVRRAVITDIAPENGQALTKDTSSSEEGFYAVTIPMNAIVSSGTLVTNPQVFHGEEIDSNKTDDDTFKVTDYDWESLDAFLLRDDPKLGLKLNPDVSPSVSVSPTASGYSTTPDTTPSTTVSGTSAKDYTVTNALPEYAPTVVDSELNLVLLTDGFSPFIIVWDELPLYNGPQTGDSASLAPWLLLLGGACALLALRRRSQRA